MQTEHAHEELFQKDIAKAIPSWNRLLSKPLTVLWQAGVPVAIALCVGAVVLLSTGLNPFEVYSMLAREAFGDTNRIDATLAAATPLIFTGLGAAFAYKAGMFTVGVEGSFVFGGLAASALGTQMENVPPIVAIAFCLGIAALAGFLVALVPALLRAWWGVDEVVTTLMLNFIVIGLSSWLVQTFFQQRGEANSATGYIAETAQLTPLNHPNQANWGLVIAVILLILYALWIRRSAMGYEFRVIGSNPKFAVAQGLRVRLVLLTSLLGAGVIGGIGGGAHSLGIVHRFTDGFSADFGFTGIAIALLARFNPFGILVGAILFGALNSGGSTVQLFINLPIQLIDILQGTVMIFAVAQFAVPHFKKLRSARSAVATHVESENAS